MDLATLASQIDRLLGITVLLTVLNIGWYVLLLTVIKRVLALENRAGIANKKGDK